MKGGKFLDALTPPTSLPDTVAIGEWLDELVGTLQSQLDMVASGAAMLPYEYLRKRYLSESIPLGATANFQHETNGTLTGRFVKLGAPNTTGFAKPVGYRTSSSQLYEVTDRVSESSDSLFAGLDISTADQVGEYGWILTGGVSPVLPEFTGAVTHLGEVGWVADESLATNAAVTVGRLIASGPDLQVLLNPQPIPVNDKTLVGSIDRLNSRLDNIRAELATKPNSTQLNSLLQQLVITSITAVNQTVDLIQKQVQRIEGNFAGVEIEQTIRAMADFRVELANARDAQDTTRQQMHVNAQASEHNKESAKVWSDQSNVYAEAAAERAAFAAVKGVESEASAELSEGYALSASLSEANALAYRNLAAKFVTQSHPTTFENGFEFFWGDGWPGSVNLIPVTDPTYGPAVEVQNSASYAMISWQSRVPSVVGKKFRIRLLVAHISGTPSYVTARLMLYAGVDDSPYVNGIDVNLGVISSPTPVWVEATIEAIYAPPFATPAAILNYGDGIGIGSAIQRLYALEMIDITGELSSQASATAAAGSAANASASEANSLTYSNNSATYRNQALGWLRQTYPEDMSGGTDYYAVFPQAGSAFVGFEPGAGGTQVMSVYAGVGEFTPKWSYPAVPNHTYRIEVWAISNSNVGELRISAFWSDVETQANQTWAGFAGSHVNVDYVSYTKYTWEYTLGATPTYPFISFGTHLTGPPGVYIHVRQIKVTDITSEKASGASATASAGSSATASSKAAEATNMAALATSLGGSVLNRNANFAKWNNPASGSVPDEWFGYGTAAAYSRVAGLNGMPYALRVNNGSSIGTIGIVARCDGIKAQEWLVVDYDFILDSGTASGMGILCRYYDNLGGYLGATEQDWGVSTLKDITGTLVGAGVAGKAYKLRHLFQAPNNANIWRVEVYFIYDEYFFGHTSKDVRVQRAAIRPTDGKDAEVVTNTSAISTINGGAAFWETIVAAGGGFPAVARLKAGNGGSEIALAAGKLLMLNPSNTGQFEEVARFEGGRAVLNDAVIRKLQVAPRSDATIYFPVQLRPKIYVGTDGQTITYESGKTLGANPDRIIPDLTGIPLASGEAFDVRATAVSATQFTIYAKKITPSAPANQDSGAGSFVGGTPAYRVSKPTSADAYNGYYSFQYDVTLTLNTAEADTGVPGNYSAWYEGHVTMYVDSGSGFVAIGYVDHWLYEYGTGYPASTKAYTNLVETLYWPNAIGAPVTHEFGIHGSAGATINNFDKVTYATQTAGTTTALTQNIPFAVYPPLAN